VITSTNRLRPIGTGSTGTRQYAIACVVPVAFRSRKIQETQPVSAELEAISACAESV
jgi:hypothetical protein